MIYLKEQKSFPENSFVKVKNKYYTPDVFLKFPITEKFCYEKCVVIFFVVNNKTGERNYFQNKYFEIFSNIELNEIDLKGYSNYFGIFIFYKNEEFLNDFLTTNKSIIYEN